MATKEKNKLGGLDNQYVFSPNIIHTLSSGYDENL